MSIHVSSACIPMSDMSICVSLLTHHAQMSALTAADQGMCITMTHLDEHSLFLCPPSIRIGVQSCLCLMSAVPRRHGVDDNACSNRKCLHGAHSHQAPPRGAQHSVQHTRVDCFVWLRPLFWDCISCHEDTNAGKQHASRAPHAAHQMNRLLMLPVRPCASSQQNSKASCSADVRHAERLKHAARQL